MENKTVGTGNQTTEVKGIPKDQPKPQPKRAENKLPKVETVLSKTDCLKGMLFLAELKTTEDNKKLVTVLYDELMSIHNQLK